MFVTISNLFLLVTQSDYARLSDFLVAAPCGTTRSDTAYRPRPLGWWFPVNLRKLLGFLVIIFVLFWIISQPYGASGTVHDVLAELRDAGDSIVVFLHNVF